MALHGEMPQTFDQIYHKTQVFLAGWQSVLEKNGEPVRLDELDDNWESPYILPKDPENITAMMLKKKFG